MLAENEGVTQRRLSELTFIATPWLVRILDRLEAMGLVVRRPRLTDRRARSLGITRNARTVLPLLRKIVGASLREALEGLSAAETTVVVTALERIITNLSTIPLGAGAQEPVAARSKSGRMRPAIKVIG